MFQTVRRWFCFEVLFRSRRPRKRRVQRRLSLREQLDSLQFQPLEAREMLYGYIQAQNDPMPTGGYTVRNHLGLQHGRAGRAGQRL